MVHWCVEDTAIPSFPGTYALILFCPRAGRVEVGKLGAFDLRPGWYAYSGSAFGPGGLRARCRHHLRRPTRPHWHMDYLRTVASLRAIWFTPDAAHREHQWAEMIGSLPEARTPIPRFGSSDCTCASHLFGFPGRPSFERFRRMARRRVPAHGPILALTTVLPRQPRGNAL
jgi:Uri superfamily endonuclease